MTDTVDDWRALIGDVQKVQRKINAATGQIKSAPLRGEIRRLAQIFFRQLRLGLIGAGLDEEVQALAELFETLIRLSEAATSKPKYMKTFKSIREISPNVVTRLEKDRGQSLRPELTVTIEDEKIIKTLQDIVPAAALSFQQAIADLADDNRVSFRGPALELREALRETLDHLAPDKDVETADGYKREPERTGPTMKQKVRFIRTARGLSKSSGAVPEQTVSTIDELVGSLTRSVYDMSSVATHVAKERKAVVRIKLYVVAVLHEMLEI
jgi:predicted pPIWI-associating nuclease